MNGLLNSNRVYFGSTGSTPNVWLNLMCAGGILEVLPFNTHSTECWGNLGFVKFRYRQVPKF